MTVRKGLEESSRRAMQRADGKLSTACNRWVCILNLLWTKYPQMAVGKNAWRLEDLVDFEVAVQKSQKVPAEVGRRVREGLKSAGDTDLARRRWGLREWLHSLREPGPGKKVVGTTRLVGMILLVSTFLLGVGVIRGLVMKFPIDGVDFRGFNIWILLAATIGIQWLILLGGLAGYFLFRYWIGGLGWLQEIVASLVKKWAGAVSPETWQLLIQGKGRQPSAMAWRFTRMLQIGGIGYNLGLLGGLFGVLWFTDLGYYWESSLSQFGAESLRRVIGVLAIPWGGAGLSGEEITALERGSDDLSRSAWQSFTDFIFPALLVWGLVPRVIFWVLAVLKERQTLAQLEFLDIEHRKLWRDLSRVQHAVTMEGMKDGIVLLDVGGLGLPTKEIRPFLLQKMRVNPEKTYSINVLDESQEREAWGAMRQAPCGVVMLVEGWSLSPKQMVALIARLRKEAGEETVVRVLVMGDGLNSPDADDFKAWQEFIDGLRDPRLECVAYEE